jgi:isopentenyl-diphosphate delta-isomerase
MAPDSRPENPEADVNPAAEDGASAGSEGGEKKRDPASKLAHIDVCLTPESQYKKTPGFERYDFVNQPLAPVSLEGIDLSTVLAGKKLKAPLMIAPMTGGVERAHAINQRLARAAEKWGLGMGVGSQRVGIEDGDRARYYEIRQDAPTALLFGNVGAAQFCKGWGPDEARRAVEMIDADALFIHLNPIQEACQGGDVDFSNLHQSIKDVASSLSRDGIPVYAREVGFGMSVEGARRLIDLRIAGIDCAGAGGTSWARVESLCAKTERRRTMGARFAEWGIPTAQSIRNVRAVSDRIPLIATGGLRSGIDLAKAIALGADVGAMARPMLVAADQGEEALDAFIEEVLTELRICMFGVGAKDVEELKSSPSLVPATGPTVGA